MSDTTREEEPKKHECRYCNKKYGSRAGSWIHEQKCKLTHDTLKSLNVLSELHERLKRMEENTRQPSVVPIPYVPPTRQYVYIIQLREFIHSNTPVYKIGKTKQANTKRLAQYPKGSELVIQCDTPCCDQTEQSILQLFKEKYTHRPDIGAEYFEGDATAMKRELFNLCNS